MSLRMDEATATLEPEGPASAEQQQYTDIYMRHNFQDTGLYPTTGALSQSPDIIPAGTQPVSDPNQYISDVNWSKDLGASTTASVANYIYVRGANLSTEERTGKFYLYYSPASLLLWPQDPLGDPEKGWATRPLKTSSGSEYVTVTAKGGARLVSPDPFRWIPKPIGNDHYCLIGRVVTDQNPNPIPQLGTLKDFARYISEHPNLAWRNVATLNPSNPVSTYVQNFSVGDEGGEVYLFLKCENAPIGSAVEASGQSDGIIINIPKTFVTNDQSFVTGTTVTLPAGFTINLAFSWHSEGKVPVPGMKITLDAMLPVNVGDELYDRARPLEEFGIPADFIAQHARSPLGPVKAIRLGSCSAATPPALLSFDAGDSAARAAATGAVTGMSFSSVGWKEAQSSVLGETFVGKTVSIKRSDSSGVEVETASMTQSIMSAGDGDFEAEVDFASGANIPPDGGQVYFMLTAQNIPVGCQVAFSSGDTEPSINLPWTTISNPTKFVTGTFTLLPAGFAAPIKLRFKTDGRALPPSELARSLSLSALLQLPGDSTEDAAPGKLLGTATVNL